MGDKSGSRAAGRENYISIAPDISRSEWSKSDRAKIVRVSSRLSIPNERKVSLTGSELPKNTEEKFSDSIIALNDVQRAPPLRESSLKENRRPSTGSGRDELGRRAVIQHVTEEVVPPTFTKAVSLGDIRADT